MNDPRRSLIALLTYPVLLVAPTGAVAWVLAYHPGGRAYETAVVSGALFATAAVLLVLQHLQPAVASWRDWRRDLPVDLAHGVLSATAGTAGARVLLFGLVATLASRTGSWGFGVWPADWPLLAQLPLALVISDLGMYWLHRTSHHVPALWRIHAVHHSSERLYTVSSGRVHPVYVALAVLCATGPILVLGAPPPVFALLSTVVGVNGLVQHSNVDLACGPYRWLLATADTHRWHHAVDPVDGACNYGNTLSWWDRMFGTFRVKHEAPAQVGLGDASYPRTWLGQVAGPFTRP